MQNTISDDLVHAGVAVRVTQPPDEGHGHGVTQQVGGDNPRNAVQLGDGDFQVQHYAGQRGDHHRLIQRGDEGPQPGDGEDGPGGAHSPGFSAWGDGHD